MTFKIKRYKRMGSGEITRELNNKRYSCCKGAESVKVEPLNIY